MRLYRSRECVAAAPVARGGAGRGGACDEAEPRRAGETEPAKKRRRRKKRGKDDGAGSGEARGLEETPLLRYCVRVLSPRNLQHLRSPGLAGAHRDSHGHGRHASSPGALLPPGAGTAQRVRRACPLLPRPGDVLTLTQGTHAFLRGRGVQQLARIVPRKPRALAAARVRHAGPSRALLPACALSPTGAVVLSPRRGGQQRFGCWGGWGGGDAGHGGRQRRREQRRAVPLGRATRAAGGKLPTRRLSALQPPQ